MAEAAEAVVCLCRLGAARQGLTYLQTSWRREPGSIHESLQLRLQTRSVHHNSGENASGVRSFQSGDNRIRRCPKCCGIALRWVQWRPWITDYLLIRDIRRKTHIDWPAMIECFAN
jgi:hypothetical protein